MSRQYYSILHKRKQDLDKLSNPPKRHRWIQAWACRLYNTTSYYIPVTLNSVTRVLQVNVVLISELCEREKGTIKFWVCCFFTFSAVYLFIFWSTLIFDGLLFQWFIPALQPLCSTFSFFNALFCLSYFLVSKNLQGLLL